MDDKSLRELVINYIGRSCNYCGIVDNLELHHSIPLYAGGQNTMGNLEVVCNTCHDKLHSQLRRIYSLPGEYPDRADDREVNKVIDAPMRKIMKKNGLTKQFIGVVARMIEKEDDIV